VTGGVGRHERCYSWQGLEQRIPDSHQDMPFVDGFPERLIREGLPGRLNRESIERRSRPTIEPHRRKIFANPWAEQLLSQNTEIVIPHNLASLAQDVGKGRKEVTCEEESIPEENPVTTSSASEPPERLGIPESGASLGLPASEEPLLRELVAPELQEVLEPPETVSEESTPLSNREALLALDQQISTETDIDTEIRVETRSERIHILGTGRLSKYVAHSIASLPHAPPVAILVHRPYLLEAWQQEGAGIRVIRGGKITAKSGIELEPITHFSRRSRRNRAVSIPGSPTSVPQSRIDNLVVTTDAHATMPALLSIKDRIRPTTTICFMEEGLGMIDMVNSKVFPDPEKRPSYALASLSHKIAPTEYRFTIVEKNAGEARFTVLKRDAEIPKDERLFQADSNPLIRRMEGGWGPFTHIMRTLTRTPELNAQPLTRSHFFRMHLEKIIVRSVIGPLTVMFDCSNEQLLYNYNISKAMAPLLEEIHQIVRVLPEVARSPRHLQFFTPEHLHAIIISVLKTTGSNVSPMLQAIRKGHRTGIEYYNGYFVRRATELGLPCTQNQMMIDLVQGKQAIITREREAYIPFRAVHEGL
jgi:2-dehydropantoate 2-reductase